MYAIRSYYVLDACVKCGACTDKCHYYIGTSDPKNMPVARQDLLRSVYRRYFTLAGKYFPKLVGARVITSYSIHYTKLYYMVSMSMLPTKMNVKSLASAKRSS